MENQPNETKPNFLSALAKNYAGSISHVALSAVSAWMIVTGLKGIAGFTVNSHTALADLMGIAIVVSVARWFSVRSATKRK
ncbi:MAG: hypothetical protein JWQ23_3221 [Herminiimonas sp.]|jgi:hypothetical protein|nr:hypothetical protein [Herminiimonas sp.]